jgi:predicted transcriptional regulator
MELRAGSSTENLSRRERQVVEALYALGEASAREVADALKEPEAYDTIRVTLGVLEKRGHLRHRMDGRRHVYSPTQPRGEASKSAWRRLTRTFFGGSPGRALISFLDVSGDRIADDELEELQKWVDEQTKMRKKKR